jgi:hypothetical protein
VSAQLIRPNSYSDRLPPPLNESTLDLSDEIDGTLAANGAYATDTALLLNMTNGTNTSSPPPPGMPPPLPCLSTAALDRRSVLLRHLPRVPLLSRAGALLNLALGRSRPGVDLPSRRSADDWMGCASMPPLRGASSDDP